MSAEAVALCMGIRDSRHTLLISTGDLRRTRGAEVGIRLGSGAGPAREAALTAALRSDDGALDRRKDLAAAAAAISAAGAVFCSVVAGRGRSGERCQ